MVVQDVREKGSYEILQVPTEILRIAALSRRLDSLCDKEVLRHALENHF